MALQGLHRARAAPPPWPLGQRWALSLPAVRAAVTESHGLGGLETVRVCPSHPGGWKPTRRGLAGAGPLPGCRLLPLTSRAAGGRVPGRSLGADPPGHKAFTLVTTSRLKAPPPNPITVGL